LRRAAEGRRLGLADHFLARLAYKLIDRWHT
jgi:hypothetical protein